MHYDHFPVYAHYRNSGFYSLTSRYQGDWLPYLWVMLRHKVHIFTFHIVFPGTNNDLRWRGSKWIHLISLNKIQQ